MNPLHDIEECGGLDFDCSVIVQDKEGTSFVFCNQCIREIVNGYAANVKDAEYLPGGWVS